MLHARYVAFPSFLEVYFSFGSYVLLFQISPLGVLSLRVMCAFFSPRPPSLPPCPQGNLLSPSGPSLIILTQPHWELELSLNLAGLSSPS